MLRAAGATVFSLFIVTGCGGTEAESFDAAGALDAAAGFGTSYSGRYNLGPVDWEETEWHNACAPYPGSIRTLEGPLLAGLQTAHMDGGRLCDACVAIQADNGKAVVARVVTYGDTGPNDIDLSPAACEILTGRTDCNIWPREMTWQLARCPENGGSMFLQFQTEANVWWTSFWVRNAAVPLARVEVQSANHASWTALSWGSDGTLTDAGGFGEGPFSIRITDVQGKSLTGTFPSFQAGALVAFPGQL